MILKAIKYCRHEGTRNEWHVEGKPTKNGDTSWNLNQINLIVGRNASGKTKTLDIIRGMADLFSGEMKLSQLIYNTSTYELLFDDTEKTVEYFLDIKEGKVTQETLKINGEEKLNRANETLFYQEVNKNLSFKTDDNILAISRRDSKQQPFFDSLYLWGKTFTHYRFGSDLGRYTLIRDIDMAERTMTEQNTEIDLKDGNDVTKAFIAGKRIDNAFSNRIIADMKEVEYPITEISIKKLKFVQIGFGLSVQEEGLDDITDQREMSQGMFRTLSLLVQLNYSLIANLPSCILIDDIGEGLDYERSKKLIDLIIRKVENSSVQVIMATNDRFVMNKVPLEYWSVIQRVKNKSLFYNYNNSQQTFDDFSLTGLNNFDFFATEFFINGFDDYVKEVEE